MVITICQIKRGHLSSASEGGGASNSLSHVHNMGFSHADTMLRDNKLYPINQLLGYHLVTIVANFQYKVMQRIATRALIGGSDASGFPP